MTTDLEVVQPSVPAELTVDQLVAQSRMVVDAMDRAMKEGTHYGKIPGVSKPSLWKAGAEKLLVMFRLGASYSHDETWGDDDHYTVRATCALHHIPTGNPIGSASGLCTTREKKYANRKPRAENYNTVLKMAQKRALVAAVLNATAASDIFTMDVEDFKGSAPASASSARTPVAGEGSAPAKAPAPRDEDIPFDVDVPPQGAKNGPATSQQIAELKRLRGLIVKQHGADVWGEQYRYAFEQAGASLSGEPTEEQANGILVHLRLVNDPGVGEQA